MFRVPVADGTADDAVEHEGFGEVEFAEPGRSLPGGVRGELETALGADLGGVRVHNDELAAARAERRDALAIAEGQDIYFGAGSYDPESAGGRRLLAHEVAHTVQARGAHAIAARSRTTDPTEGAELEAERFAVDFAHRGAEARTDLRERLDAGAVARVGIEGIVAEPRPATASAEPEGATAAQWVVRFGDTLIALVAAHLSTAVYPTGHPRLRWIDAAFPALLWRLIAATGGPELYGALVRVLAPVDVAALVDEHRRLGDRARSDGRRVGPLDWTPAVALALVDEIDRSAMASLGRVGSRVVAAIDGLAVSTSDETSGPRLTSLLTAGQVVASHPMDTAVIGTLSGFEVAEALPAAPGSVSTPGPDALRRVRFVWHEDPRLWNWIRVEDPADASPEEVAEAVLGSSEGAFRLHGAAPFFAVPVELAGRLVPARAQSALVASAAEAEGPFAAVVAMLSVAGGARSDGLASGASGEAAGLAQAERARLPSSVAGSSPAGAPAMTDAAPGAAHCQVQLMVLVERYDELGVGAVVVPALTRLVGRQVRLASIPGEESARFAVLFDAQAAILRDVIGRLDGVRHQAGEQRRAVQRELESTHTRARIEAEIDGRPPPPKPEADLSLDPSLLELAHELADVAAVSDMPELARQRLEQSDARQARLVMDSLDAMLDDARRRLSVEQPEIAEHGADDAPARLSSTDMAAEVGERQEGLAREVLDARRAQAAGAMDGDDVRRLHERVRAVQVEARLVSHVAQLGAMAERLEDKKGVRQTLAWNEGDLDRSSARLQRLRNDMHGVLTRWRAASAALEATTAVRASTPDDGDAARTSVAALEAELKALGDAEVQQALQVAIDAFEDAVWIELGFDVAAMIGIGLVSGQIVGAAGAALRGWRVGRAGVAAMELSGEAQIAGRAVALVAEAGLNAAGQTALQGGGGGQAFAENLLGDAAALAVLGPLQRAFSVWGAADDAAKGLWGKVGRGGKLALRAGVEINAMMITGAASSYVVHKAATGAPPDEQTAMEWALQGASLALGKLLHSRLHDFNQQLEGLASEIGHDLGHLRGPARAALAKAEALQKTGNPNDALALLAEDARLRGEELRHLEALGDDPEALARSGTSRELVLRRVSALKRDGRSAVAAFPELPLRLAGLEPIADGVLTGDAARIESALADARAAGVEVEVLNVEEPRGRWKVRVDKQTVEIVERRSVALLGDDADAREAATWVPPEEGTLDVAVHGQVDDFEVRVGGKKHRISHRSLAKFIRKSGLKFERIRLISCSTGKHPKGAAQHLANTFGVDVWAPTDILHVRETGEMIIGPKATRNTGKWELFVAKPSSFRSREAKPAPPERAIDRFRRERALAEEATVDESATDPESLQPAVRFGADETKVAKPTAEDDLVDWRHDAEAKALASGDRVGGAEGENLVAIERLALRADVLIEAELRVMDPLFGKRVADGFRSASATSPAAADESGRSRAVVLAAAALHGQHMPQMLKVLQDPTLDAATRRDNLLRRIDAMEEAIRAVPGELTFIDFDAARAAVRGYDRAAPTDQLRLDSAGMLREGTEPRGRLPDLMRRVVAANNAYRAEGVPREFVLGMTSPAPDGSRHVLILSRTPATPAPAENLPAKLPPLDDAVDAAGDGFVVDVGVGESAYALDMLSPTERRGLVVGTEYGPKYLDAAMTRRELTWEKTAPRVDADSVVVIGDALQTLPILFGERSVNRMFINNVNAGYEGAASPEYQGLAAGLCTVMRSGGRVEVQWDTRPEYPDRPGAHPGDREHIDGPTLQAALAASAQPRRFAVVVEPPVVDYPYTVEATRRRNGAEKLPPEVPVPQHRWIIVFE
jgi:hypothetical protein